MIGIRKMLIYFFGVDIPSEFPHYMSLRTCLLKIIRLHWIILSLSLIFCSDIWMRTSWKTAFCKFSSVRRTYRQSSWTYYWSSKSSRENCGADLVDSLFMVCVLEIERNIIWNNYIHRLHHANRKINGSLNLEISIMDFEITGFLLSKSIRKIAFPVLFAQKFLKGSQYLSFIVQNEI